MRVLEILSLLEICTGHGQSDVPCNWQAYLQSIGEVVWVSAREVELSEKGSVADCLKPCVLHSRIAPFALLDKGSRLEVVGRLSERRIAVKPIDLKLRD